LPAIETSTGRRCSTALAAANRTRNHCGHAFEYPRCARETILGHFVLSTQYLDENKSFSRASAARERYAEVLRLQPRYIEAVFKAIDERYGNFDRYRRAACI